MIYSRHEFYANTARMSPGFCCKHYILMYLDEFLTKHWLSAKKKLVTKNAPTPKL